MDIYKIVKGNSFKLHIMVRKYDISKEFQRLINFDISQATDLQVQLGGFCCHQLPLSVSITGIEHNILVCDIPDNLEIGRYNVKVSWKYDGYTMTSVERNLLQIVPHNSKTIIPIGVQEGEASGMFDLRYFIVTENQSLCPITYILDDVSLSDTPSMVKNGSKLELTLTPAAGFNIGTVRVIMAGNDITPESYSDGKIVIPAVSGYVTIMANGDNNVFYYGATDAKDVGCLNMEDLTSVEGDIVNKTITVTTTDEAPYIWFVTRVPVVFYQAGFEAAMNTTKVGDLYFYWSDELVAGDDNTYNAKLKEQ